MAKTQQQIEDFKAALIALCEHHGIGIVGTCEHESIYGEITLVDLSDPKGVGWDGVEQHLYNFDS